LIDLGNRPDDLDLLNQDQSPFTVNQSYKNNDVKQVLIDSGVSPDDLDLLNQDQSPFTVNQSYKNFV
jgi:hypothetical protein